MAANFITNALIKHSGGLLSSGLVTPIHLSMKHTATPPAAVDRLSTAISGAAYGQRTSTRLPQADMIGDLYVQVAVPAISGGGAYDAYFGLSLIDSITVRIGSVRICEIENMRAALKAAFLLSSKGRTGKYQSLLECCGSESASAAATTVCLPIPWAFSSLINGGKNGKWLPAHLARAGSREISVDITWGPEANVNDGGTGTGSLAISSAELIAHTLVVAEGERMEAAGQGVFLHHFAEIQSQPPVDVASGSNNLDLSAFRGTMGSVFFFNCVDGDSGTFSVGGAAVAEDDGAYCDQINIDGRVLEIASSAAERRLEVAELDLSCRADDLTTNVTSVSDARNLVVAAMNLSPSDPSVMTGGLALRDVRSVTADYVATDGGEVEVAITSSSAIALEAGSFVLLR